MTYFEWRKLIDVEAVPLDSDELPFEMEMHFEEPDPVASVHHSDQSVSAEILIAMIQVAFPELDHNVV